MDTNQDKSREPSVSDDSSNSAEQLVPTTPVKCDNEQDATGTEDLCSRADNKTNAEELTVDETPKVSQSEASEKVKDKYERNLKKFLKDTETQNEIRSRRETKVSAKITKSDGEISKTTHCSGNMSKISTILSKLNLRPSSAPPTFSTVSGQIPQNVRLSITPDKSESDTSNVVPETNKITSIPESLRPSVSGKTENNSSQVKVLDSSQGKSSGVFKLPTFPIGMKKMPDETSKNVSPGTSKVKESATTSPPAARPRDFNVGARRESPSTPPPAAAAARPRDFNVGTRRESPTTPPPPAAAAARPRDFNVRTRRRFYSFSPNTTAVLRRCQSLPSIKNRDQEKREKHRWSLVMGEHSRVVRSLFSDEPGPSTSESEPASANINPTDVSKAASSRDKSKSPQEESSLPKVSPALDSKPKMCRKLIFAPPSPVETENAESAVEAANASKEKTESPVKRKEASSDLVERSSVKKVRIALYFNRSDKDTSNEKLESIHPASEEMAKDNLTPACSGESIHPASEEVAKDNLTPACSGESIHPASEEVAKDNLKPACSAGEKASPLKRKAQEVDEDSSCSKAKIKPSQTASRP